MPFVGCFKATYTPSERLQMSMETRRTHPRHVPIVLERLARSGVAYPEHGRHTFVVPGHVTLRQFQAHLRKSLKMDKNWALFVMVGDVLAPTSRCMGSLYAELGEKDGFLYISYVEENTFG